jgi:hypothetical protein
MTSYGFSDPAEIAKVDRFGSDPKFPQHDGVQQWRLTFAPMQPFKEPHGKERWRERWRRRIEEEISLLLVQIV